MLHNDLNEGALLRRAVARKKNKGSGQNYYTRTEPTKPQSRWWSVCTPLPQPQKILSSRTVPSIVTAHTFCASYDTRVFLWVVATNTGIFLLGLKLFVESRT